MCKRRDYYGYTYCPSGYMAVSSFCIDRCGDGIVKSSPRSLACDDGNTISGDGCNSNCKAEPDYDCIVTELNKSYCFRKCGNGVLEGTEA